MDEAQRLLQALPETLRGENNIATLLAHLFFLSLANEAPDRELLQQRVETDPDDLEARQYLAALDLVADDYRNAMAQLLEIMRRDREFSAGAGRRGLLAVFRILGEVHPLVGSYRQLMQDAVQ